MDLIIGATGFLGFELCRQLRARGRSVRALVRTSSAPERTEALRTLGVELVVGDLKEAESLRRACSGIDHVLSTASATLSRAAGDSISSVDEIGHLQLVEAAQRAGVKHFVYTSFAPIALDFPLQQAKRSVERALARSSLRWTVLQPPHFRDVWFSPALGFDAHKRAARIFGSGNQALSWIALTDVARVAAAVVGRAEATQRCLCFGGPQALSQRRVVELFERAVGSPFALEVVPEAALQAQYDSAKDPLEQSFAALMLVCSKPVTQAIDNSSLRGLIDFELSPIEQFVEGSARRR